MQTVRHHANSQCQQSVLAVSASSQCKQTVPAVSASSQCQQSVQTVSANSQRTVYGLVYTHVYTQALYTMEGAGAVRVQQDFSRVWRLGLAPVLAAQAVQRNGAA